MNFRVSAVVMLLLFCAQAAFAQTVTVDTLKLGSGARSTGMGKAFSAVYGDMNCLFSNPAGLAGIRNYEILSLYSSMFEGELPLVVFGAAKEIEYGVISGGFVSLSSSQIPSPSPTGITYFDYYDRLLFFSFSRDLEMFPWGRNVYAGITGKIFEKGFSGSSPANGEGFSADIGLLYAYSNDLSLGLSFQNALPGYLSWSTGAKDSIPMVIKPGAAYRVMDRKMLLSFDADISAQGAAPMMLHAGLEYSFNKYFHLRSGIDQTQGANKQSVSNFTAGAGVSFDGLRIDYAYHAYAEMPASPSHFISVSFSPPIPETSVMTAETVEKKILPVDPNAKNLSDLTTDLDGLIKELIKRGYIDDELRIQNSFVALLSADEMDIDPKFSNVKYQIYNILKDIWKKQLKKTSKIRPKK